MSIKYIRIYTFIIFLIGFCLSALMFLFLHHSELENAKEKFSDTLYHYALAIEYDLNEETHPLHVLEAYHEVQKKINGDEFKTFAKKILKIHPNVHTIAWIPEVLDSDNEKALGVDIGFEKKLLEALERAKKSCETTVSKPLNLQQVGEEERVVAVFQPLYENSEEKNGFQGAYSMVIRINALIENVITKMTKKCPGINMKIYDEKVLEEIIYEKRCSCNAKDMKNVNTTQTISFAGEKWVIEAYASRAFSEQYTTSYPYIIAIVMTLLSIFISMVFYLMQKRYMIVSNANEQMRRFQKLSVGREKRIAELKEENKELKKSFKEKSDET